MIATVPPAPPTGAADPDEEPPEDMAGSDDDIDEPDGLSPEDMVPEDMSPDVMALEEGSLDMALEDVSLDDAWLELDDEVDELGLLPVLDEPQAARPSRATPSTVARETLLANMVSFPRDDAGY